MGLNKEIINSSVKESLRKKSAQSLPDVPSVHNWTPKQFKDAITKVLFDNKNSFWQIIADLVDDIDETKLNISDEKVLDIGSFDDEATMCKFAYETFLAQGHHKIYFGYIVDAHYVMLIHGVGEILLLGGSQGEIKLYYYGSHSFDGISLPEADITDTHILGTSKMSGTMDASECSILVPNPVESTQVSNKNYVDTTVETITENLRKEIDELKVDVDSEMDAESSNPVENKVVKQYIDNEIANIDISKAKLVSIIGEATTTYSGLMSAEDKTRLNAIVEMLSTEADDDNFVNRIMEVVAIFENYPETTNILDILSTKADNADLLYTNANPTTIALGGIAKGETFENVDVKEMLNKLLYPYVAFSFTFKTSPNGGVYEIGTTQTITSGTATITLGSVAISSIQIYDGTTLLTEKTSGITSGANVLDLSLEVTSNKYLTAKVTDAQGTVKSANSSTLTFVYPYYYGVVADEHTLTEDLVTGLTKSVVTKGTKTFAYDMTQQKAVIAYPASYGSISKILDANSFDVTETFTQNTLTINEVSYYVYVLNTANTTSMSYTFSY